jgi:hypothetical protein
LLATGGSRLDKIEIRTETTSKAVNDTSLSGSPVATQFALCAAAGE